MPQGKSARGGQSVGSVARAEGEEGVEPGNITNLRGRLNEPRVLVRVVPKLQVGPTTVDFGGETSVLMKVRND